MTAPAQPPVLLDCAECSHLPHAVPCALVVPKHNGYAADSAYRIDGEGECACSYIDEEALSSRGMTFGGCGHLVTDGTCTTCAAAPDTGLKTWMGVGL